MASQLRELLGLTTERLSNLSEKPTLDAQVLLAHVFCTTRSWVVAHPESSADIAQTNQLDTLLRHLESGVPLPYVLGHREFFGLDFDLTTDVLIPRPETELMVESALAWLETPPNRGKVADIGTGCGCIAISIAVQIPSARLLATDISIAALSVARRNARRYGVAEHINFLGCDMLPGCPNELAANQRFDLLCANLPYIATDDLRSLSVFGREPTLALDGGTDGLDSFRKLFDVVRDWMAPDSLMLLEIESTHGLATLSLAYDALPTAAMNLHKDHTGRDRLLEIRLGSG